MAIGPKNDLVERIKREHAYALERLAADPTLPDRYDAWKDAADIRDMLDLIERLQSGERHDTAK